jgi:hypothetical protein
MRKHCRQLGAGPRGARTTRLCRPRSVPLVSQHLHVHRIPASRVVTTAIRPSEKRGGMSAIYGKSELRKTEIFRCEGLDTISRRAPDGQINCPWYRLLSGQSGRQMVGKTPRAQSKITQSGNVPLAKVSSGRSAEVRSLWIENRLPSFRIGLPFR